MALSESLYSRAPISTGWASGQDLALQACTAGAYFAAGRLGLSLAFSHTFITPIWPATGIALAAVLLLGYGIWPGLLLGSLVLNLSIFQGFGTNGLALTAASLCVAAGNVLAALVGAWLVETYAAGREAFRQPHTIILFVVLAAVASTSLSAGSAVLACDLARFGDWPRLGDLFVAWWLADMMGVIVFTPLILAWSAGALPVLDTWRVLEAVALAGLLLVSCGLTFGPWSTAQPRMAASCFLVVPILLWTAFRFDQRGITSVTFVIACLATAGTLRGHGPFAAANRDTSLLLLQDFAGVVTVMSLLLAADVAQRRRSDEGLRASEHRYRELFENNPQPTWVYDYNSLRFLAVNSAALEHYGYSRDEFLSMRVSDVWAPEDQPLMLKLLAEAQDGFNSRQSVRHRRKDGTLIDVEVARNRLAFDGLEAGVALIMDVTERRRVERQVSAFSQLGQDLSGASTPREAAYRILETASNLLDCDAGGLELCPANSRPWETAYRMETVEGRRREAAAGPGLSEELRQRVLERGPQLLNGGASDCAELRSPELAGLVSGRRSQVLVPVRREEQVIGILAVESRRPGAYDRTDLATLQALADHCGGALHRLQAEAALRDSDDRLRLALAASRMGIWTMELKGGVRITSSRELDAIFGLDPGAFDGSENVLFELIHPEDRSLVRKAIVQAIRVEKDSELEFRILPRDRPRGWLLARGRAYRDASGQIIRLAGVAIDITALKQAEEEILRLNSDLERRVSDRTAQLEAINHELEAFSYSVSHDLRAPLRSVRGFCQVVLDRYAGQLDPKGGEFLRRAAESSRHMDVLIEDLLQFSRISRAELRPQPVDLSALALGIAAELRQTEPHREVQLEIAPGLTALGEERLLRVVLENLLRNAWKFTAKRPQAKIEFGRDPAPSAAFFVRDNGAGFDMRHSGRLFGVFQRLHSASEFPGTGIGLATVQRIVNRHGGRVWAEAVPDRGATFHFTLPSPKDP